MIEERVETWNLRAWLWVFLCAAGIMATVPVARGVQRLVYKTAGREFFTYSVLFVVAIGLAAVICFFIFKLKIKNASQYIWIFACAGLYSYFTIHIQSPEEAVHFIEYGLLSYCLFNALSYRIQDRTIYLTTVLCVLLFGTADEFFQWLIPQRFWDFRDVGFNTLGGGIFQLAMWKGIKPGVISKPVKKLSVSLLAGIITIDLIIIGLCLSNTPDAVNWYTGAFTGLSWLRAEEPMIKYNHKHAGPGGILSFFTPGTVWLLIIVLLFVVWTFAAYWKKTIGLNRRESSNEHKD
ncbi:MAG: VanZ family protein [Nitrospirae bacterium]|nr:VanZ family protein [Nitrospirota bacterium]